jgi:hypothetical protein
VSLYGEGEYCPVTRSETRTARKEHVCDGCHETIRPGDAYHYQALLFEGSWQTTKRCWRCQVIYKHLSARIAKEGDEDEFCDGRLNCGHDYRERWKEDPPPEIAALAFALPGEVKP